MLVDAVDQLAALSRQITEARTTLGELRQLAADVADRAAAAEDRSATDILGCCASSSWPSAWALPGSASPAATPSPASAPRRSPDAPGLTPEASRRPAQPAVLSTTKWCGRGRLT